MLKAGKVWGATQQIFNNPSASVHRLEINARGYCSKHAHKHKYNMFFVESGRLMVHQWTRDGIKDSTMLTAGESLVVPPEQPHRFVCVANAIVYEIYWVEPLSEDIERADTGGAVYEGEPGEAAS